MKKKVLLSSIVTIALCLSLIAGSTYALFTDREEVNIAVTAGNVDITATLDKASLLTWSLNETEADARTDGTFVNGGTAEITDDATVELELVTPGDVAKFKIEVKNDSNVNVQYRVRMISEEIANVVDLTPALVTTAYIDGFNYIVNSNGTERATAWAFVEKDEDIEDIWVTVNFPNHDDDGSIDNAYKNAQAKITFVVEAVQGNANTFTTVTDVDSMKDPNGLIADGIYNGTGNTINPAAPLEFNGNVTLANVGVAGADGIATLSAYNDEGLAQTLVLADGATVTAPATAERNSAAVFLMFRPHTLMVNEGAKIIASGEGTYGVRIFDTGDATANLVLNATDLIEATNGAIGIKVQTANVNIFVPNAATRAHYEAMLSADSGCSVSWYINGSFVERIDY